MSSSRTDTELIDVTMPQMGVSVAEGTIVAWRVETGDRIEADQTICDISTDKIDTEVPSPAAGVVAEIVVPVETTVEVGTVIARIAAGAGAGAGAGGGDAGSSSPAAGSSSPAAGSSSPAAGSASPLDDAPDSGAAEPEAPLPRETPGAAEAGVPGAGPALSPPNLDAPSGNGHRAGEPLRSGAGSPSNGARRYSPVVQRIAAEHGIDLAQVPGTGRGGRVRKQDVLAFIESGGAGGAGAVEEPPLHIESPYRPDPVPPAPAAPPRQPAPAAGAGAPAPVLGDGGLSRMRRQIGEHMKRSLETAATCTTWIEADMSRVEAARVQLGVTALSFVARATVLALREHPALNATLEGDQYSRPSEIHLGIAVSLGEDGLIVPVIHNAHELSVEGLAGRIRDLARRARSRQLTADEVRGGTFTITNPGQFGSIMATPIINQPQVGILDFEAVVKRPVVVTDADGNDSIAIRPMTIFGLSWDHRALDGAQSAQFLAAVKRHVEGWTGG